MTDDPAAGAVVIGGVPRPVPYRRVSALLYVCLAVVMAIGVGLAVHGILRAVEDAGRALALRETAALVVPAVLDLSHGTVPMEAVTEPLRDWVVGEAPDPAVAAERLDAVLAQEDPGSPRAVAREIGDAFGNGEVDGPFLTAWLQLRLRNDVEGAGESIANALAVNAGVELPRREVDDVFAVYLAQAAGEEVDEEDLQAADALAARIAALPQAVSVVSIYVSAVVLILVLVGAAYGTARLTLRFGGDAARVWRTGHL